MIDNQQQVLNEQTIKFKLNFYLTSRNFLIEKILNH